MLPLCVSRVAFVNQRPKDACAWRIPKFRNISWISQACWDCAMRDLAVLILHLMATVARRSARGGERAVVAESVLVKDG